MRSPKEIFTSIWTFYRDAFRNMTWGRPLVWLIILKLFILFAILRVFFFKPAMAGTAVGTFFTGSPFTVDKMAIADPSAPVISTWGSGWHGLEALGQFHAVLLGATLVLLTAILGALYVLNNVDDDTIHTQMRRTIKLSIVPFLVFFLGWTVLLLLSKGYAVADDGTVSLEPFKYLHNLLQMPTVLVMLLVGVVLVLWSLYLGAFSKSVKGIWPAGIGTVLVVMSVFFLAGFNGTAYYPSCTDLQSSLTIRNSSSSYFTLQVMSCVSLLIPFVLAYIVFAWRAMDRKKITREEIAGEGDKY